MKILFAPCHYIFDPNSGSESSWSYHVADGVARQFPSSVVITGFTKKTISWPYQVIELQPEREIVDMSLKNALVFNWQYFVKTRELLAQSSSNRGLLLIDSQQKTNSLGSEPKSFAELSAPFDIIHHVLPFAIGSTYNLGAIFGLFKNYKFVIGPLQTGLTYKDLDVNPSDFRSGKVAKFNPMDLIAKVAKPILSYLSYQTLQKADCIIVINQATKKLLLSQNIPENKIQIINPGLDLTKFTFAPKILTDSNFQTNSHQNLAQLPTKITRQFSENSSLDILQNPISEPKLHLVGGSSNLSLNQNFSEKPTVIADKFQILSIGYLLQRKGVDLLIEAVARLQTELKKLGLNVEIKLDILGDGPQMENLQKLTQDLNLQDTVNFVGFVDNSQIAKFYQQADVFVSMSRAESWGQMYLEAMACGVPIITTNNVGSSEIIESGQTGIIVPQESVENLVKSLLELIQNPARRIEIAQNARNILEQKYDWSRIINQYLIIYQNLKKNN